MFLVKLKRFFVGKPLHSSQMSEEKIPKWKALAVLSSDALSSVAYATEEILLALIVFSTASLAWSVPIACAIVLLLLIVAISYRQTIEAYRNGGGAYVVAKENIGIHAGLTAGASLMIGYVLTVSVSIAAGVSAVTSAFPGLATHKVAIGLLAIAFIALLNLRGVKESATIIAFPTYLFIFAFGGMIVVGGYNILFTEGVVQQRVIHDVYPYIPLFMILRAFSSGCAALTGIEAISNAVPSFKPPSHTNAKKTLMAMAIVMAILFLGITIVSHSYGIVPKEGEAAVSQLARKLFGTGFAYYLIQVTTVMILLLAANTCYNGFPWLAAVLAKDRYLPRQLAILGDRLVFSNSIVWLSVAAGFLLVLFDGDVHALIPLYAFGVFLGFTLSQVGMLIHHRRHRKSGWRWGFLINLMGAITTFLVMIVIGMTKFAEGAWIVIILIPALVSVLKRIHAHYIAVGNELSLVGEEPPSHIEPYSHTVVVPISGMHRGVVDALKYAVSISDDVRACYVEINEEQTKRMKAEWERWGHKVPFVVLKSPFRSIVRPLLDYLDDLEQTHHRHMITVIIPEFVTKKWWHNFLHNQTAFVIRAALMFKKGKVVTSVRYHLEST